MKQKVRMKIEEAAFVKAVLKFEAEAGRRKR
jgi:hypothetical protein